MSKFLGTLGNALLVGFTFLVIVIFVFHGGTEAPIYMNWLFRFLHVLFGIMWIGLLYYFNFVQIPTMPSVPAELKPAVSKYIAPTALFWFRWAALFTVLMGLIIASHPPQGVSSYLIPALTFSDPALRMIGLGMWLGFIMAFNVWFVIWPNQKRALGIVEADADSKAKSATTAMMFSRINTILSIPMLYTMVTQQAGLVG
jgi:uncharacterized membrane protein